MIEDRMKGWKITVDGFSSCVPNRRLSVRRHLAALAAWVQTVTAMVAGVRNGVSPR